MNGKCYLLYTFNITVVKKKKKISVVNEKQFMKRSLVSNLDSKLGLANQYLHPFRQVDISLSLNCIKWGNRHKWLLWELDENLYKAQHSTSHIRTLPFMWSIVKVLKWPIQACQGNPVQEAESYFAFGQA